MPGVFFHMHVQLITFDIFKVEYCLRINNSVRFTDLDPLPALVPLSAHVEHVKLDAVNPKLGFKNS